MLARGRFYQSQVINSGTLMVNSQTKPNRIPYELKRELFARLEFHLISVKIKRKVPLHREKNY